MKSIMNIYVLAFALVIIVSLRGFTHADDVTIQLGSGDGFKVLASSDSPLMDILSGGNVGIGNTSPDYKLDVSGDINFTGLLYQNGSAFSGSAWTTSGSNIYYNSGNVGIGTTSPVHKLEVNGNVRASSFISDIQTYADFVFTDSYELETLEEHSTLMWTQRHLPALKGQMEAKGGTNISERLENVVEELEKAHIYIEQLSKRNSSLNTQNKAIEARLAKLETMLNVGQ